MPGLQGRNEGCGEGEKIPQAPNYSGSAESLRGTPKFPNNGTSTLFNTVYFLPKDLSFRTWGAKLALCPGAI